MSEQRSARYTLKDVCNLSTARYECAVIRMPDCDIQAYAVPNSNNRGDRWTDCHVEIVYPDGRGVRLDHFEGPRGPRAAFNVIAREVRALANERA